MTLYQWERTEDRRSKFAYLLDVDHVDEHFEWNVLKDTILHDNVTMLKGSGDFRSQECVNLLDQADIVVTNPPFSLFREYFKQLMDHNKQFLIIGSRNAITYKDIFPHIKDNKVWLGCWTKRLTFKVVVGDESHRSNRTVADDGTILQTLGIACWFTNLEHHVRNEELILTASFEKNPGMYRRYDNIDAIEVGKVKDIPYDYDGVMGVPISYLDHHCPTQFELIGNSAPYWVNNQDIIGKSEEPIKGVCIDGKEIFKRLFIRKVIK